MATTTSTDVLPADRRARLTLLARLGRRLRRWQGLQRQRARSPRLDERTLRDIGISHYEARQEARRCSGTSRETEPHGLSSMPARQARRRAAAHAAGAKPAQQAPGDGGQDMGD